MRRPIKETIAQKREWHYEPSPEAKALGFKGWYSRGYLPHFDAPGAWQFITYRLADSIPAQLRQEWELIRKLEDDREKFRRMERLLDAGHGPCFLKNERIARIVQDNLWFHDNRSYRLIAWSIMPNHIHILAELWRPLPVVLRNWKSYTSGAANAVLQRTGKSFWQTDYFNRYIRDENHYRKVVHYIENNPVKAGLARCAAEWPWSSAYYRAAPERGQPCPREPLSAPDWTYRGNKNEVPRGQGCPRSGAAG